MSRQSQVRIGEAEVNLLVNGNEFAGVGEIRINGRLVRRGHLPISPMIQSFAGMELVRMEWLGMEHSDAEARIRTRAIFAPMATKPMRDHSLDPIHDTGDWANDAVTAHGELDLVLRPARDIFGGVDFSGFSYAWEYRSDDVPIHFILDRASWELDGDITGKTAISQSSCSDPVVTFAHNTAWTTEGVIHWMPDIPNPVMTHNLPRWASHGSFDWQHCEDATLLGVFERVGLIRSILKRESGKPELKCFDKHIFDQALRGATIPKAILLNTQAETETSRRNMWTWVTDVVHERAREEFGLRDTPTLPRLVVNYWENFTVDSYYRDLLPATESLGLHQVFVDNLKRSAMTERCPNPDHFHWNMCVAHEWEIAPALGGNERVKQFVEACNARGIQVMSWTNNTQALSSPINEAERDERGWFVKLDDTRQKCGGGYTNVMSIMDMAHPDARQYFIDSHIAIKEKTGLCGYLFDSLYNLAFMPVNYAQGRPRTMWRQTLEAIKALQDAGLEFLIESFGPFGQPQHGCPSSYNLENCWVCYRIGLGTNYTTIPSGPVYNDPRAADAAALYYTLAHMTVPPLGLFEDGQRIDERFDEAHRRAFADYHTALPHLHRRYLQEDGQSVIWHDLSGRIATIFSFTDQEASLSGAMLCLSDGEKQPASQHISLKANHTYQVYADVLPTQLTV